MERAIARPYTSITTSRKPNDDGDAFAPTNRAFGRTGVLCYTALNAADKPKAPAMPNKLYYGDNLDILRSRAYFPDACVDLIYLDPPFNSSRSYNVLFKDESGRDSDAQIVAFEDTWHWGRTAAETYQQLIHNSPDRVARVMEAMRTMVGENQMMAYLVMMAVRLVELHRVLKATGSLYLHCDPTASHYLKIILDAIFGPENFRNEIIWKRTSAHSDSKQGALHMGRIHDVILYYTKTDLATRNEVFQPYDEDYTDSSYRHLDTDGRRYGLYDITGPGGAAKGNPQYEFLGVTRYWRFSKEKMQSLYEQGRIVQGKPGSVPRYKRFLDEMPGVPLQDLWDDVKPVGAHAKEKLGYPTQKPVSLLERIVAASSNPGDVVLDPFAGCGTSIAAAHKLGRGWIGIDITHLSIALLKYRLEAAFSLKQGVDYVVIGEPEDVGAARQLAGEDRYQFQWWALSLVKARPLGGDVGGKGKKGSDKGIDGTISFMESGGKRGVALVQVKSGKVSSKDIRDLVGTVEREKAAVGVFITLAKPTGDMLDEAVKADFYTSPGWGKRYPRIQIVTVEELLRGKALDMPPAHGTFKEAAQVKPETGDIQTPLL
jgi:DNA modification methylase